MILFGLPDIIFVNYLANIININYYHPSLNSFKTNHPRYGACIFKHDNRIWAFGGASDAKKVTTVANNYDLTTIALTPTSLSPTKSTEKPTTNTQNPTKSSLNPTKKPSKHPTPLPTRAPTDRPTLNPSKYPSKYPTQTPSNNPTMSPTTCDPHSLNYTNNIPLWNITPKFTTIDNTLINTNNFAGYIASDVNCTGSVSDGCQYKCNDLASCLISQFYCNVNQCNYICGNINNVGSDLSNLNCFQARFNTPNISTNNIANYSINCVGKDSCKEAIINLFYIDLVYIDCKESYSCDGTTINLFNINAAYITCYEYNSCANLVLNTNNYNGTTLLINSYSENIIFNNGYGFVEGESVICNRYDTNRLIKLVGTDNNNITNIRDIARNYFYTKEEQIFARNIKGQFYDIPLPCDELTIKCIDENMQSAQCQVEYEYLTQQSLLDNTKNGNCKKFVLIDITRLRCTGNCANSPSQSPTLTPTQLPTQPTIIPTHAPTNAPTYTPTNTPTLSPTQNPTNAPTNAPSVSPTNVPTNSPTDIPTNAPTNIPTNAPTNVPTGTPTNAPTNAPTFSPTLAPTDVPSMTPTANPTFSPTLAPTDVPTMTPTDAPTDIPTNAPTFSPTKKPTRKPTVADWNDKFMNIVFYLYGLDVELLDRLFGERSEWGYDANLKLKFVDVEKSFVEETMETALIRTGMIICIRIVYMCICVHI